MIFKELLFPRRCPICDDIVSFGRIVCPSCENKPKIIKPPRCLKCGKHINDDSVEYCFDCNNTVHEYVMGRALYEYSSINESIYRYKYKSRCEYADFYGAALSAHFGAVLKKWGVEGIISVPLHKSKLRIRGYNQASLIAKSLSEYTNIPFYDNYVKRIKKTIPMKELDPLSRQINLKNAFILARFDVKLSRVVIVDDIYTTGSTIDAISSILKAHGVKETYFITLAIGKGL